MKKNLLLLLILFFSTMTKMSAIVETKTSNADTCAQMATQNGDIERVPILGMTQTSVPSDEAKELHFLGLLSMILAIWGFIWTFTRGLPWLLLVLLGFVFGVIGLRQINKNPKKYVGKGMVIIGLAIEIIILFFLIIFGIAYGLR